MDKEFVEKILKEALLLQGQLLALTEEKKNIVEKVQEAKNWLAKQPNYVTFLQHLQTLLHEKNIGAFSELLSYFVKDVLKKDKDIVFDLYTYHNLPALKIEALNQGKRENIIEGNGGSITNIVSTGLRLIALSRLNHRKFIVLDEPDCWLKPEHVPVFAKIIGQISATLNIQTVIISHHNWEYFKDYGRVIEVKQEGQHLVTELIHDTQLPDNVDQLDVITKVRLNKFMSHYDSVFELHPHLTCIIGENDIGKSVLTTAFKAVSYNDSSDSYIMHFEKEASVLIEKNNKEQIFWQRVEKTDQDNTQKVKYTYLKDNVVQMSEYSAHDTPKFVQDVLNICTVEDIDIHIGNQKQPVFLLSSDTKPQQRAKILSLGKESLIIQKMMEKIKVKTRQYKSIEKEGQERYIAVEKQINVLTGIDSTVSELELLRKELEDISARQDDIALLDEYIYNLDMVQEYESIAPITDYRYELPPLHNITDLEDTIIQLEKVEKLADLSIVHLNIAPISLTPISDLESIIQDLEYVQKISDIEVIEPIEGDFSITSTAELERAIDMMSVWENLGQLEPIDYVIEEPVIQSISELEELIQRFEEQEALEAELKQKVDILEKWNIKLKQENEKYLEDFGSLCPTCGQHITEEHLKGVNHA